jgi:hypothetical protein
MLVISADQQSSATLRLRYAPRPVVSLPSLAPSYLEGQNVVRTGRQYGGVMAIAPAVPEARDPHRPSYPFMLRWSVSRTPHPRPN